MRWIIAVVALVFLLWLGYTIRPGIDEAVTAYWQQQVSAVASSAAMEPKIKCDSLLILSLNFRQSGRLDLALTAMQFADSLLGADPLTKGLLGLYELERSHGEKAIAWWRKGAAAAPLDPNLSYLADLDTAELQYVDNHMLEKMFVDTIINSRLAQPLYHGADTSIIENTKTKLSLEGGINRTFLVAAIAAIFSVVGALIYGRKRTKTPQSQTIETLDDADSSSGSSHQKSGEVVNKSVKSLLVLSTVLKLGQLISSLYGYFSTGDKVSKFLSNYVLIPSNLIDMFRKNALFVVVLIVIIAMELARKKVDKLRGHADSGKVVRG